MSSTQDTERARQVLIRALQAAYPHANVPRGPYERTADKLIADAAGSAYNQAILQQGLSDLDALADGDFVDVPVAGLLDRGYLAGRAALIDPARAMAAPAAGRGRNAASAVEPPAFTARSPASSNRHRRTVTSADPPFACTAVDIAPSKVLR